VNDRTDHSSSKELDVIPSIRWIEGSSDIYSIRESWKDLERRRIDHYLSQSFEWAWSRLTFANERIKRQTKCLSAWYGDKLVAVWPFTITNSLGVRSARRLGCGSDEDYGPPLVDPEHESDALYSALMLKLLTTADIVILPAIKSNEGIFKTIESLPERKRQSWKSEVITIEFCHFGSWRKYEETLSGKLRSSIRYYKKRITADVGDFSIREAKGPLEIAHALDFFLRQKSKKLSEINPDHWFRRYEAKEFLQHTISSDEDERPRIFLASAGTAPIAAAICFVDKTRSVFFATTYDSAFARYSPGRLLLEGCISWAFDHGKDFDFSMVVHDYKERWGNQRMHCYSYTITSTLRGQIVNALNGRMHWINRKTMRLMSAINSRKPIV
jgi:CelD/BcsL family acetyltransferase involved in cellulose biosynthesis